MDRVCKPKPSIGVTLLLKSGEERQAMGKFQLEINVEPRDIPDLDDAHKRDCADAINGLISKVFKYTLIFSAAALAFFGIYSFFSLIYMMRMMEKLPQLNLFIPLGAAAIFLMEFISGTMRKWALVVQTALHVLLIFASILTLQSVWIAPFALYGVVIHIKLITFLPFYKAISEQPGFPEFTPLPTKDDVVKKEAAPEESGEGVSEIGEKALENTDK